MKESAKLWDRVAEIGVGLLILLFAYTAVSKLSAWDQTQSALFNQVLPVWSLEILLYGIPAAEILTCGLLVFPKTRNWGLYLSVCLMSLFTGYVAWVWLGFSDRVPCSCGGVLDSLGWGEHLVFNLFFLGIACAALWKLGNRE